MDTYYRTTPIDQDTNGSLLMNKALIKKHMALLLQSFISMSSRFYFFRIEWDKESNVSQKYALLE